MTRCEKCQAENEDSAQHCAKCGAPLMSAESTNSAATNGAPAPEASHATPAAPSVMPPVESTKPTETSDTAAHSATGSTAPNSKMPNFFGFIVSAIAKPISTFRDELPKFSSFANMAILAVITSAAAMLFNLISSMISAIFEKHCGIFSGCTTEIDFENLGDLDYLNLTLINWLSYLVVIAFVAAVFFGLSRAFKQNQTNFCRMASVVAVTLIPMAIGGVIGALVSQLNATIGGMILTACGAYGLLMFYEGINDEAALTGNKKLYYNFLSIVVIIVAVCILWLILSQTSGGDLTRSIFEMNGGF